MKTLSLLGFFSVMALSLNWASPEHSDLTPWADQAISPDQLVAKAAQDKLRATGPDGLRALEVRFARDIAAHRKGGAGDARWKRISAALDRVGGQYDNYASGLYWYTDMDQAKAAARISGKPILSLRLLGRLDEDLSCANSRFFRTTLYPSGEINQLLKERFVLHWESVRPVPTVTIDFGDGRKLRRTITGNSIHYILDANGRVVDALPGLYSAAIFASELRQAADAASDANYVAHLKSTETRLLQGWAADLNAINVAVPASPTEDGLEQLMDDNKWQQVAQLHAGGVTFDPAVREVVARKFPDAPAASAVAVSKSMAETPILREMRNLRGTVALDTVRNNYMLRSRILGFLVGPGQSLPLDQINNWVFATVFLTPRQDPWLGLAQPDVFSAIDGNGQTQ